MNSFFKQFVSGVISPFHSARFLFKKKSLFLLGILPHIIMIVLYFWMVKVFVIGEWLKPFFSSLTLYLKNPFLLSILKLEFLESIVWILALFLYGTLGTSFVNAVASPLYDYIAKKSYESHCSRRLPEQLFDDFLHSFLSEITKTVIVFCVFIISLFFHIFMPLLLLISVWYLGWNSIDRTLLLLNLPLKERIQFGIQNSGLCIGLGLWCYVPFMSSLFAFTNASAGALLVAQTEIPYFNDSSPGVDF